MGRGRKGTRRANPATIGAFVVIALALVVVVAVVFGSGKYFRPKDKYIIYFRGEVSGLTVGAPVKLLGVNVGEVSSVNVLIDDDAVFHGQVTVVAWPDQIRGVDQFLPEGTAIEVIDALVERGFRARLKVESMITGRRYIELGYFPDTEIVLMGFNDELTELPSISSAQTQLMDKFNSTVERLDKLPIEDISRALVSTLTHIDSLVLSLDLQSTVESMKMTLESTRKLADGLSEEIEPTTASLHQTSEAVRSTLERIDLLIDRLDNVTADNQHDAQMAIKELSAAARSLRELADYLQENPAAIMWGKE